MSGRKSHNKENQTKCLRRINSLVWVQGSLNDENAFCLISSALLDSTRAQPTLPRHTNMTSSPMTMTQVKRIAFQLGLIESFGDARLFHRLKVQDTLVHIQVAYFRQEVLFSYKAVLRCCIIFDRHKLVRTLFFIVLFRITVASYLLNLDIWCVRSWHSIWHFLLWSLIFW